MRRYGLLFIILIVLVPAASRASTFPHTGWFSIPSGNGTVIGQLDEDAPEEVVSCSYYGVFVADSDRDGNFSWFKAGVVDNVNPSEVMIADVNLDGRNDLIVVTHQLELIYFNQGHLTFSPAVRSDLHKAQSDPSILIARLIDFNGDGVPDVVCDSVSASKWISEIVVNDPLGRGFIVSVPAPDPPFYQWSAAAGDFDGDRIPDLISTGSLSDRPAAFFYKGIRPGRLESPVRVNLPVSGAVVGALSEPGREDWIALSEGSVCRLAGRELLCFGSPLSTITEVADVNHDGTTDLMSSSPFELQVSYRERNSFSRAWHTPKPAGFVTAGDLNGDGVTDFGIADYEHGNVTILYGSPGTHMLSMGTLFSDMRGTTVMDFDGDGRVDLVSTGVKQIQIRSGNGHGGFSESRVVGLPVQADRLIRLRGTPVYVALQARGLSVLDANLQLKKQYYAEQAAEEVMQGDIDGDGFEDIVIWSEGARLLTVMRYQKSGEFQQLPVYNLMGIGPLAVADLDGDHRLDLVTLDVSRGSLTLYQGLGDGNFQTMTTISVPVPTMSIVAADFDGDGVVEIVGRAKFAYMVKRGTDGSYRYTYLWHVPASFRLSVADIDGDGTSDLYYFFQSSAAAPLFLEGFLGTPEGFVSIDPVILPFAGTTTFADLNGDGHPDLLNNGQVLLSGPVPLPRQHAVHR